MKRAAVAAAVALAAWPASALAAPASASQLRGELDDLVAAGVPGALLTVARGERTRRVAAGFERLGPRIGRQRDRRFRVASVTKPLVATAILRMVERRQRRLNDELGRLLPGVAPPGGEGITVRQLLSHRSGLFDYAQAPDFLGPYLAGDRPLEYRWKPLELVRLATSRPLLFTPGTRFSYSNTDYILLGLIAQRAGHAPLGRLLRTLVFKPLRLRHTSLVTGRLRGPHVHGYEAIVPPFDPVENGLGDVDRLNGSLAWAAGGAASTAGDLTRFLRGLLRGRVLSRRSLSAMLPTQPIGVYAYGLGLERYHFRCGNAWGQMGSIFGYTTWALATKRARRVVILSLNRSTLPPGAFALVRPLLERALCERQSPGQSGFGSADVQGRFGPPGPAR